MGPLLRSLAQSEGEHKLNPLFLVSPRDREEIRAIIGVAPQAMLVVPWPRGPGDYARKINWAVKHTEEPWLFLGADDLRFGEGWADACIEVAEAEGKRVVGTVDKGNRGTRLGAHSTHSLVARSYIRERGTIDQPGLALHEGYDHQYVDNEFVETAKHRQEFCFARNAVVEHLHPHWGKAEMDATYELATAKTIEDRDLFRARRGLWRGGRPSLGRRAVRRIR